MENHQQFSDHSYIDVGGMSLRTLKICLLNWAGNRLPIGGANISFQLVFGFPAPGTEDARRGAAALDGPRARRVLEHGPQGSTP